MSCKKNVATKEKHYSKVIVTRSFPVCKAFVSVCQYLSYSRTKRVDVQISMRFFYLTILSFYYRKKKFLYDILLLIDSVSKILTL